MSIQSEVLEYKIHQFLLTECPKGFVSNIYQFQCYLFVEDLSSWYNASSFCDNKNAYLAELIDPTERIAVWNYAKGKDQSTVFVGSNWRA